MNGARSGKSDRPERRRLAGRYDLREEIARTADAVVHRAYDALARRAVVHKRLVVSDEALRPPMTAGFEQEYDTLVRLAHPNVLEAYEYGFDSDGPFYTTELLDGKPLTQEAPLGVREACSVLRGIASALGLIHSRRLVHRDLAPANVWVTTARRAKLVDVGGVAPFGARSGCMGAAAFRAPECLEDAPLDPRMNLYGFGALAYWTLTRQPPVRARRTADLPEAFARGVKRPSHFAPDVPRELDELVLALLHRDPRERPSSTAEVIARLTHIGDLPPEGEELEIAQAYLGHPPLVGRSGSVAVVDAARDTAFEGHAAVIHVEASPGLGRTALFDEVAHRARAIGATVLRTQGGVHRGAFGVARSLARLAIASTPKHGAQLDEQRAALVAFCMPELRELDVTVWTPADAGERSARILASMHDCLLELADHARVVIMVDDVHRADPESLALLAALAHEAGARPLAIVLSAASGEGAADAGAYTKLLEDAVRMRLEPLEERHTFELVRALFGDAPYGRDLARFLHTHAGGHPLRSVELVRLLLTRGVIRYSSGSFRLPHDVPIDALPSDPGAIVAARFEGLSEPAMELAEWLALSEEPPKLADVFLVRQCRPADALASLDELLAAGIVVRGDDRICLVRRAFRNALLESMDDDRRRELHLRTARAILAHEAPSSELRLRAGHHLILGGSRAEGAKVVAKMAIELAYAAKSTASAVPALEAALEVYEQQGRSDVDCLPLLVPICVAGYYGDPTLYARYLERTYGALLELTGAILASKLAPWVGKRLSMFIGLACGLVRYLTTPKAHRLRSFREVMTALFGVAATGAAAAATAYDPATAYSVAARLAPFAALGPESPSRAVFDLCTAVADAAAGARHRSSSRLARLEAVLGVPGSIRFFDDRVRIQMLAGVIYCRAVNDVLLADPPTLARAEAVARTGQVFYEPHVEHLRMYYRAFRGEQEAASEHRSRAEILGLRGGSSWSTAVVMTVRSITSAAWTRDAVGLLRAIRELERFAKSVPRVREYRYFAEAYLALLRGRPERAATIYERVLRAPRDVPLATEASETARYAEALNALGRHEEARSVCLGLLERTPPEERAYRFEHQLAIHQLALAEARLGDTASGAARLDRLLEELEGSSNPLLLGSVHRDRATVALLARDLSAFERSLAEMERWFRSTRNACLARQCDELRAEAVKCGLLSARRRVLPLLEPMDDRDAPEESGITAKRRPGASQPAKPHAKR